MPTSIVGCQGVETVVSSKEMIRLNRVCGERPRIFVASLFLMVFVVCGSPALAQQDQCENGIVRMPFGVNGAVTICSAIDAQVPKLSQQLGTISKALENQQAQLNELTRLIQNLNAVSKDLGLKRQTELLQNVSARLNSAQNLGADRLESRVSSLSDEFAQLQKEMLTVFSNQTTAPKANAAVQGELGDAIARLDFETAHDQLKDIQAQLKKIGSQVGEVSGRTKDIQNTVVAIQKEQEEQVKQQDAQRLEYQKEVEESQRHSEKLLRGLTDEQMADPDLFVQVTLLAGADTEGRWQIRATIQSRLELMLATSAAVYPTPEGGKYLKDPKLQILFHKEGQKPWIVNFVNLYEPVPGARIRHGDVFLNAVGDDAIVCFSAIDPRTSQRRLWKKAFPIRVSVDRYQVYHAIFDASAEASLTPDNGSPCR